MMQIIRQSVGILAIASCAVLGSGAASMAGDYNFAGSWVITGSMASPNGYESINPTCTLKVDGESVSGSCKSNVSMGAVDGSVDGNTIVFNWDRIALKPPSIDAKLTFRGKIDDDGVLRGQWKDSTVYDNSGTFVGVKKP